MWILKDLGLHVANIFVSASAIGRHVASARACHDNGLRCRVWGHGLRKFTFFWCCYLDTCFGSLACFLR